MAPPRLQVQASPVQPYRYGLESVIQARIDQRWDISGVEFPSEACANSVAVWPAACSDTAPPAEKEIGDNADYLGAVPFIVYAAKRCKGITPTDAEAEARRRLALGEGRAIERAFWSGGAGMSPSLVDATDPLILPAADNLVAAVAELELALASNYDGVGVIHAPRNVGIWAATAGLAKPDGPVMRTPLGTMWSFGAGYDGTTGPAGETDAPAGSSWLFATGAISRWRSEPVVNPGGWAALNTTTNDVTVFAERSVMLGRDCITIGITTTLAAATGGGGGGF